MTTPAKSPQRQEQTQHFEQSATRPAPGLVKEFLGFIRHSKKWWLAPIIAVMLLLGLLILLAGTGMAPFIYTLF